MKHSDFAGRTVLVTGGANGIGRAIADAFLAAGASVIILDIDAAGGDALVKDWTSRGRPAFFYPVDLTQAAAVQQLYGELTECHRKIDILVNNAGKGRFKPLIEQTAADWDEIINLNLRAAYILAQAFAIANRGTAYGRIINIASTRFLMSEPGSESYAASKGGLVSLTHALALSLAQEKITVNCISPGWIQNSHYESLRPADHGQHPSGRVGQPEDIARACLFLAEEENDFINGQNIVIDGGMTKKMIYME